MDSSQVDSFFQRAPKDVQVLLGLLSQLLVEELECETYVKTIYLGFTLGSEMVAAAYPRGSLVEVALALPEDIDSPLIADASHLTWPTLPVSVTLSGQEISPELQVLFREAYSRVASQRHDVDRPPEFFIDRSRERRGWGKGPQR